MRKPKPLVPPKEPEYRLYLEFFHNCVDSHQSEERYGDWGATYDNKVGRISRRFEFLEKYSFESVEVPKDIYDADKLYLVWVEYSTGDSFGNKEGEYSLVYLTEDPDKALEVKHKIDGGDKSFIEDENCLFDGYIGYAPWDGYFEHLTSTNIEFLQVI